MKVFVVAAQVEEGGCESCYYQRLEVPAAFSTKEKAEAWLKKNHLSRVWYQIFTLEIDEAV